MSIETELNELERCLRAVTRDPDGVMEHETRLAALVLAGQPEGEVFVVPGLGAFHQEMTRRTDEILDAISDLRKKRGL